MRDVMHSSENEPFERHELTLVSCNALEGWAARGANAYHVSCVILTDAGLPPSARLLLFIFNWHRISHILTASGKNRASSSLLTA